MAIARFVSLPSSYPEVRRPSFRRLAVEMPWGLTKKRGHVPGHQIKKAISVVMFCSGLHRVPAPKLAALESEVLGRARLKNQTSVSNSRLINAAYAEAQLTDEQIGKAIIADSIRDYIAAGRPCACPYNVARNGSLCGQRSAYSRPRGASPLCYPTDVTPSMVAYWRAHHS